MSQQLIALMSATITQTNQEILRRQTEKNRQEEESRKLKVLESATAYLNKACDATTPPTQLSIKGFTEAVLNMLSLDELCGEEEKLLMQIAIMARPTFLHFSEIPKYFRKTGDLEVAQMYLQQILDHPMTDQQLTVGHPIIFSAQAAVAIAFEIHGTNNEPMKQYAKMLLDRFPGMPDEGSTGFKARLQRIVRDGKELVKTESQSSPAPKSVVQKIVVSKPAVPKSAVVTPGSKIPDQKYVAKMATTDRVKPIVLPGIRVTDRFAAFADNNATARAKANKKNKTQAA